MMHKLRLIFLFIIFYLNILQINGITVKSDFFDKKEDFELVPPKVLTKAVLFSINNYNNKFYVTYLTEEKCIKNAVIKFDKDNFQIIREYDICNYEKEDEIIYLDSRVFKNVISTVHLEKYSFNIIISSLMGLGKIYHDNIGISEKKPYIIKHGDSLKLVYLDKETDTLIYKEWDPLRRKKKKEFLGDKNIDDFNFLYDENSGNVCGLWKIKDDDRTIYLSIMNKKLLGYSPIVSFGFNQSMQFPSVIVSEKTMNMLFVSDYQYKYIHYNLGDKFDEVKINNINGSELSPSVYNLLELDRLYSANIGIFENIQTAKNKDKENNVELIIFDQRFSIVNKFNLNIKSKDISNIQLVPYNENIYIFWIEKADDGLYVKYSILK